MTGPDRLGWTGLRANGRGRLLAADARLLAVVGVIALLASAPLLAEPLGRLGSPFAMLLVLPPLARALEAYGWRERLAARLSRVGPAPARLLATYTAWLATSALLTLDVAAVAAASVGIAAARDDPEERRWQLGGAVLGANVGSLLFPFSNLTNLILVAASGTAFAAYVGLAALPQLAAAAAVGGLVALRFRGAPARQLLSSASSTARSAGSVGSACTPGSPRRLSVAGDVAALAAGAVALAGGAAAIAIGLAGGDVAVPFAIAAAVLCGVGIASGRLSVLDLARTVPVSGLLVIGAAAAASGVIASAASAIPAPLPGPAGLLLAAAVGGLLAVAVNNLPAAAFGAAWLARAHPAAVVAYLVGTNVAAVATPHGSMATILARAVGARHGVDSPVGDYLRSAWRYAAVGTVAALAVLALVAR